MNKQARIIIASAITHIHPGAGRSPGVVDLPVIRDSLGYPFIRGSMIKGSIKTSLYKATESTKDNRKDDDSQNQNKKGQDECKADNDDHRLLKCLLGGDIGEGDKGAAAISIQDLYPLVIPAPAYPASDPSGVLGSCGVELGGVVYVTTWTLLSRALAYAKTAGFKELEETLTRLLENSGEGNVLYNTKAAESSVTLAVSGHIVQAKIKNPGLDNDSNTQENNTSSIFKEVEGLNPLYNSYPILDRLLVLDDLHGRIVIERTLERVTRVSIDRATKTVSSGHLWTEEYIPWGTLFIGLVVDTLFRNKCCNKNQDTSKSNKSEGDRSQDTSLEDDPISGFTRLVKDKITNTVVVGGKETVGSGILKLTFPPEDKQAHEDAENAQDGNNTS